MSNYLIDTNILLYSLHIEGELKTPIRELLEDPDNAIFVSIASVWEASIKEGKGKLKIPSPERFVDAIEKQDFLFLSITPEHARAVARLPHHHRDPFDRMMIAQAQVERMRFITTDTVCKSYDVRVLLA